MNRTHEPETPNDLRAALRQHTAAAHRRLDGLPQQRALMRAGLTLEAYAAILAGHARAQARCEARMACVAAACPVDLAPYRSRLPALQADLTRLPAVPPVLEALEALKVVKVPADPMRSRATHEVGAPEDALEAEGRYLGLRYVLDGATQGATWIAPRLAENLPELSAGRFAFWRLQQDEAPRWDEVTRTLAARPAQGRLADAAVAAACEAFDIFVEAFGAVGHAGPVDGTGTVHEEAVT